MTFDDSLLWRIRHFIYTHFVDTTRPPSVGETAQYFNISNEEVSEYYKELQDRHALFLEPGTMTIRMSNPFSGIPTDFEVHVDGRTYYANCARHMLGSPAVLHTDAVIEAVCTESNNSVRLELNNGQITNNQLLIHFTLPFARWYDDLAFT